MVILYAESFAPWCEKARWALDHHKVSYGYREHIPLYGEFALRMATRRLLPKATVPLLIDGPEMIMNSFEIARYAERKGRGTPLFPLAYEAETRFWNECSETIMTCGRALLLERLQRMPAALREQLPPSVPPRLRKALTPLASCGVTYIRRKYRIKSAGPEYERASRAALDALRKALVGGREHILGSQLSFADIAMATSLQFVRPVADQHIALGSATREAWTNALLASEYPDLLHWRDRLYGSLRGARSYRA
jgi:glutathione S-transferase